MSFRSGNHINLRAAAFCAAVLLLFLSSCKKEQTDMIPNFEDRSQVPGMHADSVTTLISDSGVIRYRVLAAVWDIYDESKHPYWHFPEKVYFERFDNAMRVESVVQSDTASYYYEDKLWKLERNVKVMNLSGEKFETHLLFWDQDAHRVYSDSFIRIEQKNQVVMGYGFESNEQLTRYRIFNIKGMFPLDPDSTEQVADIQFGGAPLMAPAQEPAPSAVPTSPDTLGLPRDSVRVPRKIFKRRERLPKPENQFL